MKKLLMALAACATTLIASAAIKTHEGFEGEGLGSFTGGGDSVAMRYTDTGIDLSPTNYPFFEQPNAYYCEVDADTSDALTSSPVAEGATYFDMYVQFPADASTPSPDIDSDAKLAVYLNEENKVVVLSGGETPTNVTEKVIVPGTWARLTIAKVDGGYKVYVDGDAVRESSFAPINSNSDNPTTAAFTGCGKLDNFVARTTDPFIKNPAATIGGEGYERFADAVADRSSEEDVVTLLANASTTLAAGNTLKVKTGIYSLAVSKASNVMVFETTDGDDVTTFTAVTRVAYIARENVTLNYTNLLAALEVAENGDTVMLDADTDENVSLPTGVSFAINGHTYSGIVSSAAGNGYTVVENNGVYVVVALPDYSPWAYASGIVVWRATSGQAFHASTVADVNEYGEIGDSYTLTSHGTYPWQVFASNQSEYTAPGKVLVFDEAGYNNNSDAQFAPLSFGGMWVKALQSENTPYVITDNQDGSPGKNADRKVELGAAGKSTYFKFDESFTFDRNSATKVLGTATVEIAGGKTFTINARAGKGAVVEAGSTLVLKGAGTLAVVGGLNVSGTLDLSAATVPTIDGDVTLNVGSTIILPAGTETGSAINVAVCSETLAASGLINVQIGDADAVQALLTVSGGAITRIDVGATYTATISDDTTFSAIEWQKGGEAAELPGNLALAALEISGSGTVTGLSDVPASVTLASGVTLDVTAIASSFADLTKSPAGTYMFTDNYPLSVPQGYTYEYVGGSTEAETATISGDRLNNSGNLKTSGYLAIDDFWTAWTTASLEVLDGKTTVGANNDKALRGTVTIRASAELVNAKAADALAYGATTVVNVYGTLSMGETRWTVGGSNTINVYGGTITGVGQGSNGALDFMDTSSLNADETSEISASIRFRNALTSVTVAENKTLTLSGVIRCQYEGGGVTKQGKGNLTFTTAPNALQAGIVHKDGHLVFNTQDDVTLTVTYNTAKTASTSLWYATQSNWKGTVKIDSLTGNLSWLTGAGNADSTISMQNVSNAYVMAAGNTTYSLPGTLSIDAPVEFNNGSSGSTVNITNLAGSSTLVLGAWSGCSSARYNLLNVDVDNGWTGTLVVSNGITRGGGGTFTVGIGNIETANTTPGRCVLPITNVELEGHTGTVAYNIDNATLNGNPANFEVKTDGIYLASLVTITVPAVANATVTVEVGGETIGTAAGNYDVEPGSVVKVTYAAAAGYQISGQTVYTIDTANSETTFDPRETTQVDQIVAQIRTGQTTYEYYTTLAGALASENVAFGITLRANIDEDEVTISSPVMITGAYTISSDIKIVDGGQLHLMLVTLAGTLTIEENGIYVTGGGTLNELITKDGAKIQLTTLSDTTAPLAVNAFAVEGDLTIISSWGSAVRDTYYKALSFVTANAVISEGATVDSVNEWSAKVEEEGDNTVVYLAITKVAVVDGVYYDNAQDAVDAAVVSGNPVSFLVDPGTVKLGAGETLVVSGATLPTVALDDELTTPPYEIERTIDAEKLTNTYAVKAYVAQITRNEYSSELGPHNVIYKYESLRDAVAAANAGETIVMTYNDSASFANIEVEAKVPSNGSIVIDKNLTINGAGFTVYGNTNAEIMNATGSSTPGYDMVADLVNGSNLVGFFVKSGNVTFTNITLTEFGDTAYVNKFGYTPIQTASAYTGTLTLTGVNFNKFNRTAVCVRGGTLAMTGGTIAGGTVNKNNGDYFQQPVEVRGGTATISGVTITGGNDISGNGGGAIVAWSSATLNNVVVDFTGYGVWSDGPVVAITGEDTSIEATVNALFAEEAGTITVAAGDFTGSLAVDSDPNSSIVVSGGTFDRQVPAAYCASGKVPTTTPDASGKYTVVDYVPPSGIDPESGTEIAVDTSKTPEEQAADAQAAAAAMDVQKTADAASVDQTTWNGYFTKTAEKVNDVWMAKAELNPAVVLPVDGAEETPLTDMLESVAAAAVDTTGKTAAEIPTKAGLYYWISGATEVNAASYTPGIAVLGDGTNKEIARPTLTGENGKAFFKVCVDIVAPTKE